MLGPGQGLPTLCERCPQGKVNILTSPCLVLRDLEWEGVLAPRLGHIRPWHLSVWAAS